MFVAICYFEHVKSKFYCLLDKYSCFFESMNWLLTGFAFCEKTQYLWIFVE